MHANDSKYDIRIKLERHCFRVGIYIWAVGW